MSEIEVERLYSELFEAAAVGRRHGEFVAARAAQTQARWQTLWTLADAPLTVPQVARRLGVSRQHILRLTNELENEGLVASGPNPDHKTSPLLTLTEQGRTVLGTINDAGRESNRSLLATMSPEGIEELRGLLRRFTSAVKDLDAD